MFKYKIFILFSALVAFCQGIKQDDSKFWLISCKLDGCSFAFASCMNCFGERSCKTCITLSKPECSACADDIYNKDDLETIGDNKYFICDSSDPIQSVVCHLYCRGQFKQSGQCRIENNLPVCKCSSESNSITTQIATQSSFSSQQTQTTSSNIIQTITPDEPFVYFNGTVKLNVSISLGYQRILPLPNGDVVRGRTDNLVEIWDVKQGVIKKNLSSVYRNSILLGLLSNGDLIAGYSNDKVFLIWDLKISNGEQLKKIIQAEESFNCLKVLKNDDLAIGEKRFYNKIVIRNSQNGNIRKTLVGHSNTVSQIIEMENGNLVSCSFDTTVKIWNITNGSVLKSISHTNSVYSIAFLKNGYLAAGLEFSINIWNLETNQLIRNLNGHSSYICENNCLQVLNNGDLLSGSNDKSIKVWNPYDGTVKFTSKLHTSSVRHLSVLPSGNIISSSQNELVVWS